MKHYTQPFKVILLAAVLSFGVSFVYAWAGPTATPPNGNASAPINTSANSQYKGGALGVEGILKTYSNIEVGGWVAAQGNGNGQDPAMRIGIYDMDNTGGVTGWWLSHNQDGKFAIHQGSVGDRLNIDGSGNVGIGTASPTGKLQVNGNDRGRVVAGYNDGIRDFGIYQWDNGGGSGNEPYNYFQNNVGIGTTAPTEKLEVVGGITKTTGGLIIETRTSDPTSPANGQMWLRTDI